MFQFPSDTTMNAYLFTAGVSQRQIRACADCSGKGADSLQIWDASASAILYGGELEQAQKKFEVWCCQSPEGQNPIETQIKKIVVTQFVERLFNEAGGEPLDWPGVSMRVAESIQATVVDDFEQGYWVDINQALPPGKLSADIESLQRELPEDISSGLNWSPDKQFFFLVTVLTPLPPFTYPDSEPDLDAGNPDGESAVDEGTYLDPTVAALPELRDKETAVLVEARNSVVAAWLWRRFVATSQLAAHEIQVSPCCAFVAVE
jgi:hypothetical protein